MKKTQDTLGKAIKKPPLTEKLLNKPPFRFLHDIITEVIKNTGVLGGLFSDDELNSANVTDKDAKMNFLQKAIDCVGIIIGEALAVRPSKIVAGHEPEKTNEFLQHLGKICLKKVDTSASVEKVIQGEKPGKKKSAREGEDKRGRRDAKEKKERDGSGSSKQKDDSKETKSASKDGASSSKDREGSSKSRESSSKNREGSSKDEDGKLKVREGSSKDRKGSSRDREGSSKDREGSSKQREGSSRDRESTSKEKDSSSKAKQHKDKERESSSKERSSSKEASRSKEERSKDREKSSKEKADGSENREKDELPPKPVQSSKSSERMEPKDTDKKLEQQDAEMNDGDGNKDPETGQNVDSDEVPKTLQRPASAKGQRRRPSSHTGSDEDEDVTGKDINNEEVANQMDARKMSSIRRPSSARPAPPRVKKQQPKEEQPRVNSGKAVPPVIVDNKKNLDDEDEDDTFIVEEDPTLQDMLEVKTSDSNPDFINTEEHGSLVRKMLESKKEADSMQSAAAKKSGDSEKPVMFDAARKKEREVAEKEIERLRGSIQHLVRSAHPLGKIMDYVQEDIDSMQKELNTWREENARHEQALKAEASVTESEIAPLQTHLEELEREIGEVLDSISVVKSNILRNEEKIEQLVVGVSMY